MSIRPSVLAGEWYSEDARILSAEIQSYLDHAEIPEITQEIFGMISPHAGYIYSGKTAAYGYKALIGRSYDLVVILSPLHHFAPAPYITQSAAAYQTPLGDVPVDHEAIQFLSEIIPLYPVTRDQEHSIEIQLPFLQSVLSEFKLLPIMIGHADVTNIHDMVQGLTNLIKNKKTLIIASSDMHHISNYDQVLKRDGQIIQVLETYDTALIRKYLFSPSCTVCGKVGISISLEVARNAGGREVHILHTTNSGEVTGNKRHGEYTVGYLSAILL